MPYIVYSTNYTALKGEMSATRPGIGSGCWSMPLRHTNDNRIVQEPLLEEKQFKWKSTTWTFPRHKVSGPTLADKQSNGFQGCFSTVEVNLKNPYFPKYLLNLSITSIEELNASLPILANISHTRSLLQRINFTIENTLFHTDVVLQIWQVSYLKKK